MPKTRGFIFTLNQLGPHSWQQYREYFGTLEHLGFTHVRVQVEQGAGEADDMHPLQGGAYSPEQVLQGLRAGAGQPVEEEDRVEEDSDEEGSADEAALGAGHVHLQGCFYFASPRSCRAVHRLLSGGPIERCHLEPSRSYAASRRYCSKDDTRLDEFEPFESGAAPGGHGGGREGAGRKRRRDAEDYWDEEKATQWQRDVLAIVDGDVDRRAVHWFWEEFGGVGKSVLARHIVGFRHAGRALMVSGKAADIKYGIASFLQGGADKKEDEKDLDVVIIDVPRTNDGHVSYQAIEAIKNGLMFSTKYESGMVVFNSPHVVVFANTPPEREKLSADRWHVHHIASL